MSERNKAQVEIWLTFLIVMVAALLMSLRPSASLPESSAAKAAPPRHVSSTQRN